MSNETKRTSEQQAPAAVRSSDGLGHTKYSTTPRPPRDRREMMLGKSYDHPALKRTWWVNLYPDGQMTGTLCETKESALNRCTYTGDKPDAIQVEVRLEPVS